MESHTLLQHLLPKEMNLYFDLLKIEEDSEERLFLYLDEKPNKPQEYFDKELVSKGFDEPVEIQDYPLRGKAADILHILYKIPLKKRQKVKYISTDMANNMEKIATEAFPNALVVTDRFHVAKLITDAVQIIRIKYRWDAIDEENLLIEIAKKQGIKYQAEIFENGDTKKQLLARSRYLLFKTSSK